MLGTFLHVASIDILPNLLTGIIFPLDFCLTSYTPGQLKNGSACHMMKSTNHRRHRYFKLGGRIPHLGRVYYVFVHVELEIAAVRHISMWMKMKEKDGVLAC